MFSSGLKGNPGDPPHRIFDYRYNSAIQNLEGLREFITTMQKRADDLSDLRVKLAGDGNRMREAMQEVQRRIGEIKKRVERATSGRVELPIVLREIEADASFAEMYLAALRSDLDAASKNADKISVLKTDPEILVENNASVVDCILKQGRKDLNKIKSFSTNGGPDPWQNLRSLSSLWGEYLDYLAGLSLRHDGLDNGICDIADGLIKELKNAAEGLSALAVPGREGALGVPETVSVPKGGGAGDSGKKEGATQPPLTAGTAAKRVSAKTVYLRFPEWTVWAVPLTAYELWHIARRSEAPRGNIVINFYRQLDVPEDAIPNDDFAHDHFADAFAVSVMGPAYCAAALLLALDPLAQHDRDRAAHILYVLQKVSDREEGVFDPVLMDLKRLWEEAVAQTSPSVTVSAPDEPLTAWTDELIEFLSNIPDLMFPTKRWTTIRIPWVKYLKEGGSEILLDRTASIRFALTSAWKARMEKPAAFSAIGERCRRLCGTIMSPQQPKQDAAAATPPLAPSPTPLPPWENLGV